MLKRLVCVSGFYKLFSPLLTSFKTPKWSQRQSVTQFSMAFYLVWSVLLRVCWLQIPPRNAWNSLTAKWGATIWIVFEANTPTKQDQLWKASKCLPQNGFFSCVPFSWKSLRGLRYHFFRYRYDTDTFQVWKVDTDTILILYKSEVLIPILILWSSEIWYRYWYRYSFKKDLIPALIPIF